MITKSTIRSLVEDRFITVLTKRTREREFYYARMVYFKLCREYTNESLAKIGRSLGYDHATVLNALAKFDHHHGMPYFRKYDIVYRYLCEYIEANFITTQTERKAEIRCVEDVQNHYRVKAFKTQEKYHKVISNMRILKDSTVIQKISEMEDADVQEFQQLAEVFYKRKRAEKSRTLKTV